VVEIAPGRGRWTRFLLPLAERLHLVDQSPECIEHCRKRFADAASLSFAVNDGRTLVGVADASVDFLFTYDSLVHAEFDVMKDYLAEFRRTLRPGGFAFVHHSNLHQHVRYFGPLSVLPRYTALARLGLVDNRHWRAMSVSAERIRAAAEAAGLHVWSQEVTTWVGSRHDIDCMSVFCLPETAPGHVTQVVHNPYFQQETDRCKLLAKLYAPR
jgi:ubiquinone/menaquinone biosynthesis C-methylase UbiE